MITFPIMNELFSSDSGIFLLVGLAIAFVIGLRIKTDKTRTIGMIASIVVYALCELLANMQTYIIALIALYIGTVAVGCFIGLLFALIVSNIKKHK